MASQPVTRDPSRGYQKSNTFWRKLGELGSDQELALLWSELGIHVGQLFLEILWTWKLFFHFMNVDGFVTL